MDESSSGAGTSGPSLPKSKFGAGYTVGADASPPAYGPVVEPPPAPQPYQAPQPNPVMQPYPVVPVMYPYIPAPVQKSNTLATVSFVLVLVLGACVVPITIPMGHVARSQCKARGESGEGLALAALIISYIYLGIAVAIGLVILISALGASLHRYSAY